MPAPSGCREYPGRSALREHRQSPQHPGRGRMPALHAHHQSTYGLGRKGVVRPRPPQGSRGHAQGSHRPLWQDALLPHAT